MSAPMNRDAIIALLAEDQRYRETVADALLRPEVTTVGDLTARHVGRRVRVAAWDAKEIDDVLREPPHPYADSLWVMAGEHVGAFLVDGIDTPCALLPREGGES